MAGAQDGPYGLLTPMPEEATRLHEAMEQARARPLAGLRAHEGYLAGVRCLLVECGVGKVAAAAAAQGLCATRRLRGLLVLGIAGGITPEVHLGDVIVVTETVQHDLDARPFFPRALVPHLGRSNFVADEMLNRRVLSAARRLAPGLAGARPAPLAGTSPQVHAGTVLTGDQVIGTRRRRESLQRAFPGSLGVDMETAAVAQVAHQNRTPWAAVRVVSDGLNDRINPRQVLDYAATTATVFLRDMVLDILQAEMPP